MRDWEQLIQYIAAAVEHGSSAPQIAEHIGVKLKYFYKKVRGLKKRGFDIPGLEIPIGRPKKPKRFTGRQRTDEYWETVRANVVQWVSEKVTRKAIAERLGIKESSVSNRIYRWRQEGHPVPYPHPERTKMTAEEKREKDIERQKEIRERKRLIKLATKKPRVRTPKTIKKPEVKQLATKHIDMEAMKSVKVDSRTSILVPADKDSDTAIAEWKKRYNKQ